MHVDQANVYFVEALWFEDGVPSVWVLGFVPKTQRGEDWAGWTDWAERIDSNQAGFWTVVHDEKRIYYLKNGEDALFVYEKETGEKYVLWEEAGTVSQVIPAGDRVILYDDDYNFDRMEILSLSLGPDSELERLYTLDSPAALSRADESHIYWLALEEPDLFLRRGVIDGSEEIETLSRTDAPAGRLFPGGADDSHLYLFDLMEDQAHAILRRMPWAGGPAEHVATLPNPGERTAIWSAKVDGDWLYWAYEFALDEERQTGLIVRMPKGGGSVQTVLTPEQTPWEQTQWLVKELLPSSIAIDDLDLYWGCRATHIVGIVGKR